MSDPASLANSLVSQPEPELREATILDDAAEPGQEIRCVVPSLDLNLATDPMSWVPYVTATGVYYPKQGERAVLSYPPDGPPVIQFWEPAAGRAADASISTGNSALGVIVHGADPEVKRGAAHAVYMWIGSVLPYGMEDNDLLAKYA